MYKKTREVINNRNKWTDRASEATPRKDNNIKCASVGRLSDATQMAYMKIITVATVRHVSDATETAYMKIIIVATVGRLSDNT